ncbi:class I SAM-dependent methyltransferase [Hespellia stercorisuis]|uniref:Methyltransferase domain-containing protein n=1 Tax=Hespellia stercorisuis DSM 15480 TaxID=1121950 RepID=A0A1M6SL40_9FIRM|nr:SAM-dependent methyltransferase [Hespellia stercorisuis]SHK45370.1 Methyltransferase domain-containing protein [Hespellia stercorisuis DSM 15480]
MKEILELLNNTLNADFHQATISNPRTKDKVIKVKVRPILKGEDLYFQLESFTKTQAFHENLKVEEACGRCAELMQEFRQMQITTKTQNHTVLVSKKGKVTIQSKRQTQAVKEVDLSHNRSKKYILEEGVYVPFLQDLGVMTADGKIVRSRMDKFRQINRFLEFIEDILPQLDKNRELTILDFGCGKSYLTFAMYYYLHELKKYDIRIIGLDLKADVIRHCSALSEKYGYEKLKFLEGNIADYTGVDKVDMVVTLHACDTATDYALAKAIGWDARVILSVPCCQHELNGQMKNEILAPIMEYGLLKERMAALATDGLRAEYLDREGYDTQVLEFIDMEHTPKNILLRAVKNEKKCEDEAHRAKKQGEIEACVEFLQVQPTLGKLLDEREKA